MGIISTAKNEHTLQYIKTKSNSDLYKSNYDLIDWSQDGKAIDPRVKKVPGCDEIIHQQL